MELFYLFNWKTSVGCCMRVCFSDEERSRYTEPYKRPNRYRWKSSNRRNINSNGLFWSVAHFELSQSELYTRKDHKQKSNTIRLSIAVVVTATSLDSWYNGRTLSVPPTTGPTDSPDNFLPRIPIWIVEISWEEEEQEKSSIPLSITISISCYCEVSWFASKRPNCKHLTTILSS